MPDVFTRWQPEKVKAAIRAELMERGELVGKFVETEARRRLLAITDPDWGQRYRELIVSRLLTFRVDRDGEDIVVTTGVAVGPQGRHHGFWIEVGSKTAAAHPFLRPAVWENARRIVQLVGGR